MHLGVILPKSQPGQDILQGFGQVVPVRFGRFRNEPDPVFFRLALAVGPDEGQFQEDPPRQGAGRLISGPKRGAPLKSARRGESAKNFLE